MLGEPLRFVYTPCKPFGMRMVCLLLQRQSLREGGVVGCVLLYAKKLHDNGSMILEDVHMQSFSIGYLIFDGNRREIVFRQ